MSVSNNLQDIIIKQKAVLEELEQEANLIIHSDLTLENESFKREIQQLQTSLTEYKENLKVTSAQNIELKNALHEQIYSEKIQLINMAQKKSDVYFQTTTIGEQNRLVQLEQDLLAKTNQLKAELETYRIDTSHQLYQELNAIQKQVAEAVTIAKTSIAKETGAFSNHSSQEFEKLKDEQITEDIITAIGRKNNLEAFVGGNLLNKLGVLFVILGIIAVSRFTFYRVPDIFKGIIMFALSGGFLLLGEFINQKKASVFSLGITSCGVAGLYVSLSISYFGLDILSMYPAIFLCILITLSTFVLSQRYESQTIASFALIGGYIPLISAPASIALTYSSMVYFIILNLLALSLSFYKKWKISMFIGYFLNLFGTLIIVLLMFNSQPAEGPAFGMHQLVTILYVLFAFSIYTLIPLLSNYRLKQSFTSPDVVILGLNTFFSALTLYMVFMVYDISRFNGLTALIFAIIYIYLGKFVEKHFNSEKRTLALFYLTGMAFVVLVIPLQFGKEWLSLGWLAQGVALAVYGILAEEKVFKKSGFIIGGLCLFAFLFFDVFLQIDNLFSYKYLAITLGSISILVALLYKRTMAAVFENAYKYAAVINLWFYSLYLGHLLISSLPGWESNMYNVFFLSGALSVVITFLFAMVLPRIPYILDKGIKIISVCLSIYGMLKLILLTSIIRLIPYRISESISGHIPVSVMLVATLILIALCALAVLAMRNVLLFFVLETKLPAEWLPFGISAYFLIILTQNLIVQFRLSFTSLVISMIYVIAALAWIVYGFTKRFAFMRRFGLGLSILAVAKLFLIDLSGLTQGYKIISYFAFGITLLGISFVYQHFSKRLTVIPEGGITDHVEENNP